MQINYRILEVNENEGSAIVRYWTDELSEKELSIDPDETEDHPVRCRTDFNINIHNHNATEDELHAYILQCAPVDWFELKHKIKNPNVDTSLSQVKALVGKNRKGTPIQNQPGRPKETDLTYLLED